MRVRQALLAVVMLSALSCLGKSHYLESASAWTAMGSDPMEVTSSPDGVGVVFSGTMPEGKKSMVLWPLISIPNVLEGLSKLRFKMKIEPADAKVTAGVIVVAKQKDFSGRFIFDMPKPGAGWQTVEVNMEHPNYNPLKSTTLQIAFTSFGKTVRCSVADFFVLDKAGKEIALGNEQMERVRAAGIRTVEENIKHFFVEPGQASDIVFKSTLPVGGELEYDVLDYSGKLVKKGKGRVEKAGELVVRETFEVGHYDLVFPSLDFTFGVCSQKRFEGKRDGYFAIEGLMENRSEKFYSQYVDVLLGYGVGSNREWHNYSVYSSNQHEFRERTGFYVTSGQKGLKSIFCFADFPSWYGVEPLRRSVPQHLLPLSKHIEQLLEWRKDGLEAFHVLNEYDLWPRPAESNVSVIKVAGYAMRDNPLILAAAPFCRGTSSEAQITGSIRNGLLDYVDVFTCHTYSTPESIEDMVGNYRKMLSSHPKGQMPMWITESGKAWSRNLKEDQLKTTYGGVLGAFHPKGDEERLSALWICMKAVEAKTCGVAKLYPFTMPFFQENNNNFGMTDYWRTPLRSMTGYFRVVQELSGFDYVGDYADAVPNAVRFRVFRKGDAWKGVLYMGSKSSSMTTPLQLDGVPVLAVRTLDGRPVNALSEGGYGGMFYVDLDGSKLEGKINEDTVANGLRKAALAYKPIPRVWSPVIYQFRHWEFTERNSSYYEWEEQRWFKARLYNMSDKPVEIEPELILPEGGRVTQAPFTGKMTLPPRSDIDVEWQVDFKDVKAKTFEITLRDKLVPHTSLCVPFVNMTNLVKLPFGFNDAKRWRFNTNGKMSIAYDEKEKAIRIDVDFKDAPKGDFWIFPEYVLALPEESLKESFGLEFEIKFEQCSPGRKVGSTLVMMCRGDAHEKAPYDGLNYGEPTSEWKRCRVMFSPGEKDEDRYKMIRIGMCPKSEKVTYWLRNIQAISRN